jgi:DNA-binding CsgD family transcriptional regulator
VAGPHGRGLQRDAVLTSILRRRRRPILLIIDEDGDLVFSSVPDSAASSQHRLLGQALAEAKNLFQQQSRVDPVLGAANGSRPAIDQLEQRSTLIALGREFFSLRVILLHRGVDESGPDQFAALVEPIVEPLADRVDLDLIKVKYRLSNREVDVLEALMSGRKDKEIASNVGLTPGTVRSYLKSIRAKLGVTTRTAIVNLVHEFVAEGTRTSN